MPALRSPRLRTLLIVYFSLLLAAAMLATGMIVYQGGYVAAERLVESIQVSSLQSIQGELDVYLSAPMQVNQTNLTLARSGFLDLENTTGLVSVLWSQGTLFPDLGTIAFANDRGEFVGANRPENYVVLALQDETGGAIRKLEPGPQGEITGTILSEKPGYDARKRSWYQDAVAAGHATWTDINLSVTTARLDLSAVTPHYDPSGTFRGVFLVDVALPQITRFLQEHLPDERAVVFIVDRKGALVASSAGSVVHRNGNGARLERATATQSADPVVAHAALYVQEQWGGFSNLRGAAHGTAELSEGLHFISAAAYQHGNGLDWVIVSAIPETAVTGPIQASAQSTLALGVLAFLLTVLGGVWIAHWVANPLAQIAKAAKEIGAGAWSEPLRLDRSDEVGELAEAFNGMAQRLKTSLDDLSQEVALRTRQAHELEESEQRTRAMVRAMPDILFVMGEDGRFLDCQSPDPNHLYLPPGEIIGKTIAEVLPPESAVAFTDLLERTRAEGTLQTLEYTLPIGDRDMFFEARTVPYQQGQTLALCRDITERHIAEREFRSMEQQAAQSQRLEAIGTLSSGIAHDFNNLLQAILGYAELLSFELKPGSPPHEHAEKVKSAAERGRVLVQGLLAFNRKEPLELGPVSLNREVEQSVALLERTLPKMVSIRTHLAEDLHPILGDANQLSQILLNLGINARDAMPEGGVLRITTRNVELSEKDYATLLGAEPGKHVLLEVADTGVGIERSHQARIFEPFFTTKEVGKGSGLGLSAVYGIVKNHRGSIACTSTLGQGTRFSIFFPAIEDVVQIDKPSPVEPGASPTGKGTILLVDDELAIRDLGQGFLEDKGYRVLTAASGEEALARHRSHWEQEDTDRIDLVVLDLGMPGMGGRKCLQALQGIDPGVRVLIATGYSMTRQGQGILDAGIAGYIGKPYRLDELASTIGAILSEE